MLDLWDVDRGHAVREAGFNISLMRPLSSSVIRKLADESAYSHLKKELPKLERFQSALLPADAAGFQLTGGMIQAPISEGLELSSYRPDGQMAWRLRIEHLQIVINCLDYESWEVFSARAVKYALWALQPLRDDAPLVAKMGLQYINCFTGSGDLSASFKELLSTLRADNEEMPPGFWGRTSPEFHVNQGYFDSPPEAKGPLRQLSRHALQSVVEGGKFTTLLDIYKENLYRPGSQPTRAQLAEGLVGILTKLRVENRKTLRQYLCDEILEKMGAVELHHAN